MSGTYAPKPKMQMTPPKAPIIRPHSNLCTENCADCKSTDPKVKSSSVLADIESLDLDPGHDQGLFARTSGIGSSQAEPHTPALMADHQSRQAPEVESSKRAASEELSADGSVGDGGSVQEGSF